MANHPVGDHIWGHSFVAMAAQFAAGVALIVAGVLWGGDRPTERTALLLALGGMAWFMPVWIGWYNGPAAIRTLAMLIQPVFLPLVCHVVVSICGGGKRLRVALMLYLLAATLTLALLLVTDPLTDPGCWNNCTDNVLLVTSQPWLARMLAGAWTAVSVAAGLTLATGCLWRLRTATRTARRLIWLVTVPASVLASPSRHMGSPSLQLRRKIRTIPCTPRSSISKPGQSLRWPPGRRAVVTRPMGKASAEEPRDGARCCPETGIIRSSSRSRNRGSQAGGRLLAARPHRFVNGFGEEVLVPARDSRRAIAKIVRDGEPIAVISHYPALVDPSGLVQAIGPAARLAIDNERFQA